MKIGVPQEIKNHEYRVGMTPESVAEAVHHGHTVLVEHQAGAGIGASDEHYQQVGATVVDSFRLTIGNVNDAPVLGNNQMVLYQGDTVVITPAMLSATDVDHAAAGASEQGCDGEGADDGQPRAVHGPLAGAASTAGWPPAPRVRAFARTTRRPMDTGDPKQGRGPRVVLARAILSVRDGPWGTNEVPGSLGGSCVRDSVRR